MKKNYQEHTRLNLENREPTYSLTFYNCSEYRAFLATSQLSSEDDSLPPAQCLTITLMRALQMCRDCRINAELLHSRHQVKVVDRYVDNFLIQKGITPSMSTRRATYVSIPLKQPYVKKSTDEPEK